MPHFHSAEPFKIEKLPNHNPGECLVITGDGSFKNTLPDFTPLEKQIPLWVLANVIFKTYIPPQFTFSFHPADASIVTIDDRWMSTIIQICPIEDRRVCQSILVKSFEAVQGFLHTQAAFWREVEKIIRSRPVATRVTLNLLNNVLYDLDQACNRANHPTPIDIFKHVAGVKFCGEIKNIYIASNVSTGP